MNKVKNILKLEPVPTRSKLVPKPKITSLADLVNKDNLDIIKNEAIQNQVIDNNENEDQLEVRTLEEEIDTEKTKKI